MIVGTSWARRPLTLLAAAAAVPLLLVVPASADTVRWTDPAGDMWTESSDDEGVTQWLAIPDETHGDIVKGSVRHRRAAVVIRVHYTDLIAEDFNALDITSTIRTDEGITRSVTVWAAWGETGVRFDAHNGAARCPGITYRINWERNTTFVRVPRPCLSRPRWIRVDVGETYIESDAYASGYDQARSAGAPDSPRVWTRRLFRG